MSTLENAIALAVEAHRGQKDRAGQPYILHPLRVMMNVEGATAKTAAILHDVVEDSPITLDDLTQQGFSPEVVAAVDCLTKRPDEDYEPYLQRVEQNALAIRVKLADLRDNMTLTRLDSVSERDIARLQRYLTAWHRLHPQA